MMYMTGLLSILAPLPIIYVSLKYGAKSARIAVGIAMSIVLGLQVMSLSNFTQESQAVFQNTPNIIDFFSIPFLILSNMAVFLCYMLIGLMLADALKDKCDIFNTCMRISFVSISISAVIGILAIAIQPDVLSQMIEYIDRMLIDMIAIVQTKTSNDTIFEFIKNNHRLLAVQVMHILPAFICLSGLLVISVNATVSTYLFKRIKIGQMPDLMTYRVPDIIIWGLILSGFIYAGSTFLLSLPVLASIAINGVLILLGVYFLQGIAVIAYFFSKRPMPFLRLIVYFTIIIFFSTMSILVIGLGIADVWLNLRMRLVQTTQYES